MGSLYHHRTLWQWRKRFNSSIISKLASTSNAALNVETRPISKLLIANRGEIACRIMKTAKRLGVTTVAVFSDADRNALHVRTADEAYHIGAPSSQESYLRKERILDVAKRSGADAIHPGYGFLSENAEFAELCDKENVIFVGPPPNAIRDMGLKNKAKSLMASAGVPVVLGYHGTDQSDPKLKEEARRIGYPVMLKAVRGGGGKGMRIALRESDFDSQLESARREAMKSFGNDEMIVEKFVVNPRHVEVQIFGDKHGNYVYLFERDCSVQRRHQKIIEEAPAPGVDDVIRRNLGESAVKAARAVDYVGAGTVEFIMDPEKRFYFMEMNTRLQVEHPVSEMITGFDFVEWQLRVAAGEKLPVCDQREIVRRGHSFEARIYAEDTENGFMPAPGTLNYLDVSTLQGISDVRVETGVQETDEVSVHYDPMIAKLVVWGLDRSSALKKLDDALSKFHISGVKTNISFLRRLAQHVEFHKGNVYTDFIKDYGKDLFDLEQKAQAANSLEKLSALVGGLLLLERRPALDSDPFSIPDQFRLNLPALRRLKFRIHSKQDIELDILYQNPSVGRYALQLSDTQLSFRTFGVQHHQSSTCQSVSFNIEIGDRVIKAKLVKLINNDDGDQLFTLFTIDGSYEYSIPTPRWLNESRTGSALGDTLNPTAPMPGIIEKVLVKPGQQVKENDPLVVMVAMKMEYVIKAPKIGCVDKVLCKVDDNVPKGAQLILFKEEEKPKKSDEDS